MCLSVAGIGEGVATLAYQRAENHTPRHLALSTNAVARVTIKFFSRGEKWSLGDSRNLMNFPAADVNNVSKLKMAGSCTAAAFLKEFAPKVDWMHLDIAGVMGPAPRDGVPYLVKGMTGRPTRALIHLLALQC